jgi:imidazoleglycerol-phosphate dehydratase
MRKSEKIRKTRETEIQLSLNLDGGESCGIDTGCGFFDHMLKLFACHGGFGLSVSCRGDTEVDYHHTVEDVGIVLGNAFAEAIGDKAGIRRYGSIILPMDEALALAAVDISGRGLLVLDLPGMAARVGDFDTELVEEFFAAFARHAGVTLHIRALCGSNTHHIIEAAFKAFARALRQAVSFDPAAGGAVPSSKGVL